MLRSQMFEENQMNMYYRFVRVGEKDVVVKAESNSLAYRKLNRKFPKCHCCGESNPVEAETVRESLGQMDAVTKDYILIP